MKGLLVLTGIALALCASGCADTTEANTSASEEHSAAGTTSSAAPTLDRGPGTGSAATSCKNEITSNVHTSCPFAEKVVSSVLADYEPSHSVPAHVSAYSPVTNHEYTLACALVSGGLMVECSTGDAQVVFPLALIQTPATSTGSEEDEVGSTSHAGDAEFCENHECIGSFTTEEGTVVECSDGTYSHAGGISGACSDHGGEKG